MCCHRLVGFVMPSKLRHSTTWQLQWQNSQGYSGSSPEVHPGFHQLWHSRLWEWDVTEMESEREWGKSPGLLKCEYSPGWKPLPSLCKHMLFEFISLPRLSPAAPSFSLWQSCHACYFTENTIWYRRSPSSFHLSIGKDRGRRAKCKAKWKWQAGERSNSLWHEALKTPHLHFNSLHGVNSGSFSTQTNL